MALYGGPLSASDIDTFFLMGECGMHFLHIHDGMHDGLDLDQITAKIMSTILSLEDFDIDVEISIFPNPVTDILTISRSTENAEPVQLMIYNTLGEIVEEIVLNEQQIFIDVHDFPGWCLFRETDCK